MGNRFKHKTYSYKTFRKKKKNRKKSSRPRGGERTWHQKHNPSEEKLSISDFLNNKDLVWENPGEEDEKTTYRLGERTAKHTSDKRLVQRKYRELLKFNIKNKSK